MAHVGTLGRRLLRAVSPNGGSAERNVLFTGLFLPSAPRGGVTPAPFPYYDELATVGSGVTPTIYEDSAASSYHSLQLEVRRQLRKGLEFRGSFTYSHAVDDSSDLFDSAGSYAMPQSADLRGEAGPSSFDAPYRFTRSPKTGHR